MGIVWFHSGATGHQIAYTALPFFLLLLAMPTRGTIQDRAKRLLRPWLIWSAIFGAGEVLRAFLLGQELFGWFQPSMLLYGTMIHLWFLPFAFLAGYILTPLRAQPNLALLAPLIVAAFVAIAPHSLTPPFPQWIFGAVPAVVGAAFFSQKENHRYLALVSLLVAFLVLQVLQPKPENSVILIGCALAILAFLTKVRATAFTNFAAQISFPIYLSHPIFLFVGRVFDLDGSGLACAGLIGSILFSLSQVFLMPKIIGRFF